MLFRSSENFRRPFVIEEGLGLQYQPLALLLPLRLVAAVSGFFTLIFTLLLGFLSLRLAFSAAGLALAIFFLPFSDDVVVLAGWALLRRLAAGFSCLTGVFIASSISFAVSLRLVFEPVEAVVLARRFLLLVPPLIKVRSILLVSKSARATRTLTLSPKIGRAHV